MDAGELVCRTCQRVYDLDAPVWRCACGGLLDIGCTPRLDREQVSARLPGMWRYREAIALREDASIISFAEGFTPLLPVRLGGREVLVKQDHLFPTGSYKDRGASVLISQVKRLGIRRVVEDSSGNAGCAIAAYCAQAGIACAIYVPADTSPAKLAQITRYGAELVLTPGSREETARAVLTAAEHDYYASHSWNPWFFEGTKTFAYEVCEQLGWQAPDEVILPVGNGTLLLGAAKGFRELLTLGVISHLPRLVGVQAEACAPLARAFDSGEGQTPFVKQDTLAEGIAIAEPVRGRQILTEVRQSGGTFITVTEDEIRTALLSMCCQGFYIEPTAAATIAGVEKAGRANPAHTVVTVFTGHGLKATEKMLKL